jgi:Ca2+-binding EF-hand superfamily protein
MDLSTEALANFVKIDKNNDDFLSRDELTTAQNTGDARTRLVAEALLTGFDWIKNLSNDEFFSESQISESDLGYQLSFYRDKHDTAQQAIDDFPKLDLNNDGFVTMDELRKIGRTRDSGVNESVLKFLNADVYFDGSPGTFGGGYKFRMSGLVNDEWGHEKSVSIADLEAFRKGSQMLKRLELKLQGQ